MNDSVEKKFITAQELLEDSFRLGLKILESDFRPKYIVGVWRGGTPVGIAIQELLEYYGLETDHIAIRTSSYTGIDKREKVVRVHGLEYLINRINAEDGLLIADDVFDSGRSIKAIIKKLKKRCRRNTPEDIRIATVYYRSDRNITDMVPEFFIHDADRWLVFPHEMDGLSPQEIREKKGLSFDLPDPGKFRKAG